MSTVSKMILDKESLRSNQCNQIPIHVPSHSFKTSRSTTQRKSHIFALQEGAQVVKWRQGESSKGWKDRKMSVKFGEVHSGLDIYKPCCYFVSDASDLDDH